MAKLFAYAAHMYNQCNPRRAAPDSEYEGCDEILAYLVVKNPQDESVKITDLVQSLQFGTGPTVH